MHHSGLVHLLGTAHVDLAGAPARPLPARAYALLALLRLDFDDMADRGVMAARLWEASGPTQASGGLRMLLMQIRRWEEAHGVRLIHGDTKRIWRDHECLPVDLDILMRPLEPEAEAVAQQVELYRGDLLEGFEAAESPELELWLGARSEAICRHFVRTIVPPARDLGGPVGEKALRRALDIAPYSEEVMRALLLVLGREGAAETVLREYRAFEKRMRSDLDMDPDDETRALAAQLTRGIAGRVTRSIFPPRLPYGDEPDELTAATSGLPRVLILPPPPPHFSIGSNSGMLATALIEDVTLSLCKMKSFAVFAPHTARQVARGTPMFDPQAQAVSYTLSTRLLASRTGGLRLGLSLMRNATGEILFGDDMMVTDDDLASRHAELSSMIVRKIVSSIDRSEVRTFRRTGSASAYVQFLLGNESMRIVELADLRRARKAFRQAVHLEPEFTPALAALARTLTLEWLLLGRKERDLVEEAQTLARRAVEIDPFDAAGHRELGHAATYMGDFDAMLEHTTAARMRAPHQADLLMDEADALVHMSRAGQAAPLIDLALSLNPLPPDEYYWTGATVRFFRGEYRLALETILKMKQVAPANRLVAACAAMAGERELARQYRDRTLARQPDFRVSDWAELVPMQDPAYRKKYVEALKLAGFH
jgi:DNA-binding SARP family transcriptional activator/TolB-like protein/cytochrome c-type biogenesis protein CcmH/NrfG